MIGPRFGAHMSIAGGPAEALRRAQSIGCDTLQMFTRSSNRWDSRDLTAEEIASFHLACEETGIHPIVAHSSYLINLASSDEALWERSLGALIIELQRCQQLGIRDYVLHPGSHKGTSEEQGLRRVADALTRALQETAGGEVIVLLETTAGQGDSLGCRFEQLSWLLSTAAPRERLGVCLDTAHVLAAGYEYRDARSYAAMWQSFDTVIGRKALRAIHINDSKRDRGSRVDRHEQLGQGYVGIEALRLLANDRSLWHVPMILETPKGPDMAEDVINLALIRSLVNSANDTLPA